MASDDLLDKKLALEIAESNYNSVRRPGLNASEYMLRDTKEKLKKAKADYKKASGKKK